MSDVLPGLFLERLQSMLSSDDYKNCLKHFSTEKPFVVRLNILKEDVDSIKTKLQEADIKFKEVQGIEYAIVLEGIARHQKVVKQLMDEGVLYSQSLSSMLPVLCLDPKGTDSVLDACAAPGSKTTQIAALMQNEGEIVCLERSKNRFFKLQSVVKLLESNVQQIKCLDARRFRPKEKTFDKILVDAPCSSEGRFKSNDKKSYRYWSPRKIKEMAHKQKGILLNMSRLLKPSGTLVYSTCTFAPEENEGVIDWFLKKTDGAFEVEDVHFDFVKRGKAIPKWIKKDFSDEVKKCLRVLPTETMEGFFIAKLVRR